MTETTLDPTLTRLTNMPPDSESEEMVWAMMGKHRKRSQAGMRETQCDWRRWGSTGSFEA